jgi:hypothetical protein
MIRKLMILLMLTICNTVFAQSMDSSVCLIAVDEPLKKTGGNQVNTCDPKIIQNMITEKGTSIVLKRFTNQGELTWTTIWGHNYDTQYLKIKPSFIGTIRFGSTPYRGEKNLIYTTTKSGCTVIQRIVEDTPTHLSLKDFDLKGPCDDMRGILELKTNDSPDRYRKIKY